MTSHVADVGYHFEAANGAHLSTLIILLFLHTCSYLCHFQSDFQGAKVPCNFPLFEVKAPEHKTSMGMKVSGSLNSMEWNFYGCVALCGTFAVRIGLVYIGI